MANEHEPGSLEFARARFEFTRPGAIARRLGTLFTGVEDLHSLPKKDRRRLGRDIAYLFATKNYFELLYVSQLTREQLIDLSNKAKK